MFVFADDLSYYDMGAFGNEKVRISISMLLFKKELNLSAPCNMGAGDDTRDERLAPFPWVEFGRRNFAGFLAG